MSTETNDNRGGKPMSETDPSSKRNRAGEPVRRGTDAEGFPHGSKYPLFVGMGMFFTALGLLWLPILLIGVPVLLYGTAGWTREYAIEEFERGIVPEQKRQRLGLETGLLSMYVVVAGEILIFLALFVSWFYLQAERGGSFPPGGDLPSLRLALGGAMAVSLVLGSLAVVVGRRAIERDERRRFLTGFVLTFILGVAYLGLLGMEWRFLISAGLDWTTGPYGATYYALTGLHALHVLVGLVLVGIVIARATFRDHFSSRRNLMPRTTEVYWHFIALVSVLIVAFVYLPTN